MYSTAPFDSAIYIYIYIYICVCVCAYIYIYIYIYDALSHLIHLIIQEKVIIYITNVI